MSRGARRDITYKVPVAMEKMTCWSPGEGTGQAEYCEVSVTDRQGPCNTEGECQILFYGQWAVKDFRQGLTQTHLFVFGKTSPCVLENGWQCNRRDKFGGFVVIQVREERW